MIEEKRSGSFIDLSLFFISCRQAKMAGAYLRFVHGHY